MLAGLSAGPMASSMSTWNDSHQLDNSSSDRTTLLDLLTTNTNSSISNRTEQLDEHLWSFEFAVVVAGIMALSSCCTVVGNVMVLMVIIRHRGMRTRTNLFLLNLAVTDLLVGALVQPFSIYTLLNGGWVLGPELCSFNGFMNGFCLIASFHTLMYISIHKYYSIVRPLSNPLQLMHIVLMMAAAWAWAAVCSTLNVLVLEIRYKPGTSQCGPLYPDQIKKYIVHGLLQVSVFFVPLFILLVCYSRMFIEIKRHSERLRTNSTVEEDFILSQQKKVTITLFIVLATFVIMIMPYIMYAFYTTIKQDKTHFPSFINPVAYMFLYLSSMCNPIIYAFRSPAFREGYKEILCQTPNYVVSDECDQNPRTSRLSSIIPSFRWTGSLRPGNRLVVPAREGRASTLSPTGSEGKQVKPKFGRQRSLLELLRSTRQSSAQSVVHRNGDFIIMKEGKIVSVRRAQERTPFLDRLKTLAEVSEDKKGLTAGLAGTGQVMVGLVCEGLDLDRQPVASQTKRPVPFNHTEDMTVNGSVPSNHSDEVVVNGVTRSPSKKEALKQEILDIKKADNCSESDHSYFSVSSLEPSSSGRNSESPEKFSTPRSAHTPRDASRANSRLRHELSHLTKSTDHNSASSLSSRNSGPCAAQDTHEDILSEMPLTPRTRDRLAKSDINIFQGESDQTGQGQPFRHMHTSHSSEHILRKRAHFHRLPSLEFLDPPVHLFRSLSNLNLGLSSHRRRARSKSPRTDTQH